MKGEYGQSENGNFKVIDTIPTKHYYMITPKHLEHCHSGVLSEYEIERMEREKKAKCGVKGCSLGFKEHEIALLIECKQDIKDNKELESYLLKIKEETEKNGYVGFAFKKSF